MGLLSLMEAMEESSDPFLDELLFWQFVLYVVLSLSILRHFSIAGRPVAHSDRKLASKHKKAETEQVEILERLSCGSKLDEARLKAGDDSLLRKADLFDVEREPLRSSLLPTSTQDANVATISLSTCPVPMGAYKLMKKISEESVHDSFLCSSDRLMLQSKVELHDGMLERLKDLLKEIRQPPKEFILGLQIDSWAILKTSGLADGEVGLLRLPVDEVPVILHAEYAAGLLTITGLNLEDADIHMSAENAMYTLTLNVWRLLKPTRGNIFRTRYWRRFSDTEEDIATVPVRLSSTDMKSAFVYATKKVHLGGDGQSVNAVSKAVRVIDSFWPTVFRLWVPTVALWMCTIYCTRYLVLKYPYPPGKIISNFVLSHGFFLMILAISFFTTAPKSVVEFFKYHVETLIGGLGQGLLVFYYGFKSLNGPRLEFPKLRIHPPAPNYPPPPRLAPYKAPPTPYPEPRREPTAESVDDPDWECPAFDEFEDRPGKITLRRRFQEVPDEVSPFRAVYIRKSGVLWPDVVRIDLFSTPLIKIVQKLFPRNGDLQCLEHPNIKGRDLFLALEGLKHPDLPAGVADDPSNPPHFNEMEGEVQRKNDGKGELHAKHLVRFLEKEFSDVSVRLRRMTEEKRAAWDMLWAFFTPGEKVVYTCDSSQEVLAGVVSTNTYVKTLHMQGEKLFSIDLEVWDYDGKSYHKCQINRKIKQFEGELTFSSLPVRPIEMEGVPELLDEGFLANGKRFRELGMSDSHRFMHYSGPMFRLKSSRGCMELVQENADGRVMIDRANFARMNPGYPMGNAKPPVASGCDSIDPVSGRKNPCSPVSTVGMEACDETLIFAPAILYGFSFTLKKWGSFAISGFSEISFDSNAFDALVMEPDRKQLVYELVSQYIATPVGSSQALQQVDPISNKGEGCIFLCYGPPGTGKTLTAESLAENMHRPLWSLSASELGTTPNDLEQTLFKILDIAADWRAILLLDEADVFLEKRSSPQNLTRNAMTGVFLRFLEYYRGVLFLNTNRIETFDSAFRSRISMFLHYSELSIEHKAQVWTTLLGRTRVAGVTAEFIAQMAAEDINGREIRNIIHMAQIRAKSKGQTLCEDHVRYAKSVLLLSLRTLSETLTTPRGKSLDP